MSLLFPDTAEDLSVAFNNAVSMGSLQVDKPELETFFARHKLIASEIEGGAFVADVFLNIEDQTYLRVERAADAASAKLAILLDARAGAEAAAAEAARREAAATAAEDAARAGREALAAETAEADKRLTAERGKLSRDRRKLTKWLKELDAQPGDLTIRQEALRRAFAAYEKETGS